MKRCVRELRIQTQWNQVQDFTDLVQIAAERISSEKFETRSAYQVLERRRLGLPWDRSDAQIQSAIAAFDDHMQYEIQSVLYEVLLLAYRNHLPDCGGVRGIMLMIGLMRSLTSIESALGLDFCEYQSAVSSDLFGIRE